MCTKLSEHIGTDSRIKYIKFGVNIENYEYCCKFEIKYCGKTVLTDSFNISLSKPACQCARNSEFGVLGI